MTEGWALLQSAAPESVAVGGALIGRHSRVVLHPNGSDPLTRALDGRTAVVDAVLTDLEDHVQLAVVLDDDPARYFGSGRNLAHRFFFLPGEIEPVVDDRVRTARVLVAGIGNVFRGDDGFGVAVIRRLSATELPHGTDVVEFGIRGMDLAYALNDGYDAALLVDAAVRGEPPGTVSVVEPDADDVADAAIEGHGLDPARVLALARRLGTLPRRTLVIACEPQHVTADDDDLVEELSPAVAAAVEPAAELIASLVADLIHQWEGNTS